MKNSGSDTQSPQPGGACPPTGRCPSCPRWPVLAIVLLLGGLAAYMWFGPGGRGRPFQPTLPWHHDSREALAEGQRLSQPVLMVFTQPGCMACARLEQEVLGRDEFEAVARGRVVLAELDIHGQPTHRELLRGFGGLGTPTVVLTDPAGQLFDRFEGAIDQVGPLTRWLAQNLARWEVLQRGPAATQASQPDHGR